MLTNDIKKRLAGIYELVKRGTDGEKAAAERMLDKILKKHNLQGLDLDSLNKETYPFKYANEMEYWLFGRLAKRLLEEGRQALAGARGVKGLREIRIDLTAMEWAILESSYEYFRRHMRTQWKKVGLLEVNKCRKNKTKTARRKELQSMFYNNYIYRSGLYDESEITGGDYEPTRRERKDAQLMSGVEGGKYVKQVNTGLMIGGCDV